MITYNLIISRISSLFYYTMNIMNIIIVSIIIDTNCINILFMMICMIKSIIIIITACY